MAWRDCSPLLLLVAIFLKVLFPLLVLSTSYCKPVSLYGLTDSTQTCRGKLAKCWHATQMHCCQMVKFWATGLKNVPVKLFAALEISGLESGPVPNFLIAA